MSRSITKYYVDGFVGGRGPLVVRAPATTYYGLMVWMDGRKGSQSVVDGMKEEQHKKAGWPGHQGLPTGLDRALMVGFARTGGAQGSVVR